ncbi:MAG: ABC transporter ATP-binding protein [Deltaproteobacteria bacterium]|nr:ABC transporter ATP-binding protein [Deltaproteobacteria bacterium]
MVKQNLLHLHSLGKTYKSRDGLVTALAGLDLDIHQGEIFGLLGPNGAGKTTTVKMIMGLMRPSSGTIVFRGQGLAMADTRSRFGYLPENYRPNPNLTVGEYINCQIQLAAAPEKTAPAAELLKMVGLAHCPKRRVANLSKGMGQRLGLAQAFAGNPDFLILDEPTSGLDPIGQSEVIDLLIAEKEAGKTIFFCSHILSEVARLCDRIGILVAGELRFLGTVDDFLSKWQAADLDEGFRKEVQCARS